MLLLDNTEYIKYKKVVHNITYKLDQETNLCPSKTLYKTIYNEIKQDVNTKQISKDLTEFLPHPKYKLVSTIHTQFIALMIYNSLYRKENIIEYLYCISLIYYNTILNKFVKYCDNNLLDLSIKSVRTSNLFKKYTVKETLNYISESVYNLYKPTYNQINDNPQVLELLFYSLRTRLVQSLKSIVKVYYRMKEESKNIENKKENFSNHYNRIMYKIRMLGFVSISNTCLKYKSELEDIKDVDEKLIEDSLTEIYNLYGTNPSQQNIVSHLSSLYTTYKLLNKLHLDNDALYCLVQTLLLTGNS